MKSLTISIPDELEQRLNEIAGKEHRSPSETACEILRRRLLLDRFHDLCRESEPLARAAGYESEDDLLRDVS